VRLLGHLKSSAISTRGRNETRNETQNQMVREKSQGEGPEN